MTIEVQCTSCHTRYRIDEQVLPEGTPTFKCSRCGHVFTLEPRNGDGEPAAPARTPRVRREQRQPEADDRERQESPAEATPSSAAAAGTPEASTASADENSPQELQPSAPEEEAAPKTEERRPSTDELLSRPFQTGEEEAAQGENLKFDFSDIRIEVDDAPASPEDEPEILADTSDGEWQVGESDFEAPANRLSGRRTSRETGVRDESAPKKAVRKSRPPKPTIDEDAFVDEEAAPIYNHSTVTHSARFFIAVFTAVALLFGVITVLVHGAPAAAADVLSRLPRLGDRFVMPMAPARMVAMLDVHSDYVQTKGGHTALVVTGIAQNVSQTPLHAVKIAADLRDADHRPLAHNEVYCGNNLSAPMVAQMTPHELEFFLKLDPPKTFSMEPAGSSQFVLVFVDPPPAVSSFDVMVAAAAPADEPQAAGTGG